MTPLNFARALFLTALLPTLTGCSDAFEDALTIDQGVAGYFTISSSDIPDAPERSVPDEEVAIYLSTAVVDGVPVELAIASTLTARDGFFEIELDDGDYAIVNKRAGELTSRMLTVASNVVECNLRDSGGDLVWVCPDL